MRRVFQIGTFPSTGAGKAAKVRILCIHPLRRLRYSHPPWGLQKLQMRWVTEVTFPFFSYQKSVFEQRNLWSCLLNAHLYISMLPSILWCYFIFSTIGIHQCIGLILDILDPAPDASCLLWWKSPTRRKRTEVWWFLFFFPSHGFPYRGIVTNPIARVKIICIIKLIRIPNKSWIGIISQELEPLG